MCNKKPNQVDDPWYIPTVNTGKLGFSITLDSLVFCFLHCSVENRNNSRSSVRFGAPNYTVRVLHYYHRYLTEHPELRKGRTVYLYRLDTNNAGKELCAATITRWIWITIVDSHAALQNSKIIPGSVKSNEVGAVATSLQLFNKVDLQTVMKAGRWSSGGTFTSIYLSDLCPQGDRICKTRPVVAARGIVMISCS